MMDFFNFSPTVETTGSYYTVSGINLNAFELDLRTNFGTSVIFSRIIKKVNNRRFRIHKFFMVELAWILEHFTSNKNKRQVDRYRVGMYKYKALFDEVKTKTWISTTFETFPSYDVDKAANLFNFKPFPSQYAFLKDYSRVKFGYQLRGCLLDAAAGSGKALSLDSKIKIPGGWTTMGEIKLGDIVTGKNGLPTKVVGVYPQGEVQLFTVTFADGRSVETCAEHLWTVWENGVWKEVDTKFIKDYYERRSNPRIHIPLVDPEETPDKEFLISPYLLGALLGDGGMTARGVTFTNDDEFVVDKIKKELGVSYNLTRNESGKEYEYRITNNVKDLTIQSVLRDVDLMGKICYNKFIPEKYMTGSIRQRWELLQGLMDTDGSADSMPIFNTSSLELAKQVQELVRSLGGIATLSSRIPSYTYKGEKLDGAEAHRVYIRIKSPKRCFTLPRKQNAISEETQYSDHLKLKIESVVESRVAEAQCITVDADDHLYVTNDYIVTHNTFTSLVWAEMLSPYKTLIIVPKHLVNTPWKAAIESEYFKKAPKVWSSLDGTDPLRHMDCKYFIIYKENLRRGEYDTLIDTMSKKGKEPIKIIIDESHNYNEHSSQQSTGLIDICNNRFVSDVLFMSGTPIKAQGKETYTLFASIDDFFNKDVREDFSKMYGRDNAFLNEMLAHRLGRIKYTIPTIEGMGKPPEPIVIPIKFDGCERYTLANIRLEMMEFITERVSFYNKMMPEYINHWNKYIDAYRGWIRGDEKEEALLNQYIDIVKYFQKYGYNNFTDSDKSKFCKKVETNIENELKGEDLKYFRHIKSAVKYVGLKIRGEALGRVLSKLRMEAVRDIIKHAELVEKINSVKKKTAIYTSYIDVIKELEIYLESVGMKSISVSGENSSDVDKVIATVRDDKDTNPLITTFNTLREGYPLLMCNQIILMNSPFRNYELTQTIARIHRKGQDEECFILLLDLDTGTEENITSRSIDIMEWSKDQVEVLLGGGKLSMVGGNSAKAFAPAMFSGFESFHMEYSTNEQSVESFIEEHELLNEEFHFTPKFKQQSVADVF